MVCLDWLEGYCRVHSEAGVDETWIVKQCDDGESFWRVIAVDEQGNTTRTVCAAMHSDTARWIVLAHNSASTLVRQFREALERAQDMEEQRDDARCEMRAAEFALETLLDSWI